MLQLTAVEARVLGALVEKSRTTPDHYPLTLNALTTACNQSTNREPVTDYAESAVEEAVRSLRGRKLVRSVRTSRSRLMKHQHDLEAVLVVDGKAAALLAVLMLRGAQTAGELRTRTDRYEVFDSLDEVEEALQHLGADDPPLVRRLERQPGQKEPRWTELLTGEPAEPWPTPSDAPVEAKMAAPALDLSERLSALEQRVAELEARLDGGAARPA